MLRVWITGSSFSTCCHSKTDFEPYVEALAVLAGGRRTDCASLRRTRPSRELERRGLDRERDSRTSGSGLVDAPGAVTDDVLGVLAEERQARADAVRRVPHRRKARPSSPASRPCPAGGCRGGTGCARARPCRTGPSRTGTRGCRPQSPSSCRPCRSSAVLRRSAGTRRSSWPSARCTRRACRPSARRSTAARGRGSGS